MTASALPPEDLDSFLESLALILTEESLESVLTYGVRLAAGTASSEHAALFLIDRGQITGEFWHPPDAEVLARLGPEFRTTALHSTAISSPFAILPSHRTPSGTPFKVILPSVHGDLRIALCLACGESSLDPVVEKRLHRLAELLVSRIATHDRHVKSEEQRQRYERWFKTLDQQLRLLDRERQKFSAVVSQSDLYVFVADVSRTIRWTNKSMATFLRDDDRQPWLGRTCSDVCSSIRGSSEAACEQCPLVRALGANEPAHQELHHGTGESVSTFYFTALPIRGPDGVPNEVMVMVQDLTDLRVLRKSESRYRLLFERSANAILMVRPQDRRIVLANGMAGRMLGCVAGELIGLDLAELHAAPEWSRLESRYTRVMSEPQPEGFECVLHARNGDERMAVAFATRFDLEHEEVVMLEFLDITARKRAERTLWEREEQLRQSQKIEAVGKLAGGVAHDFNNMLSVVMGRTELVLERLAPNDPQRADLMAIHSATTRGAWLVRQLLAFGQQEIAAPQRLDLRIAVTELVDLMRSLIGEKIELETVNGQESAEIRIDRAQIEQLLVNLVINARDAMPHGGRLTIAVDRLEVNPPNAGEGSPVRPGTYVTLTITDTGHGMDESTRARLFEPFFTTKESGQGSGLGLSVVYGIVAQHGGHVQVASERGLGTTVRVCLPFDLTETRDGHDASSEDLTGRPTSILLVEDNDAVRAVAREALEMEGFVVMEAPSGVEALEICSRNDTLIDLIISDVVMPRMGGGELVRRVTTMGRDVKVLLISGYTDDAMVRHGIHTGVPFLQKPFSLEALSRKVREVLQLPAASRNPHHR